MKVQAVRSGSTRICIKRPAVLDHPVLVEHKNEIWFETMRAVHLTESFYDYFFQCYSDVATQSSHRLLQASSGPACPLSHS
jgi:hypothetical protein